MKSLQAQPPTGLKSSRNRKCLPMDCLASIRFVYDQDILMNYDAAVNAASRRLNDWSKGDIFKRFTRDRHASRTPNYPVWNNHLLPLFYKWSGRKLKNFYANQQTVNKNKKNPYLVSNKLLCEFPTNVCN